MYQTSGGGLIDGMQHQHKKKTKGNAGANDSLILTNEAGGYTDLSLTGNQGRRKLMLPEYQNSQPYMNQNHSQTQKPVMAMMMTKDGTIK
jgi:hypothetical protein